MLGKDKESYVIALSIKLAYIIKGIIGKHSD